MVFSFFPGTAYFRATYFTSKKTLPTSASASQGRPLGIMPEPFRKRGRACSASTVRTPLPTPPRPSYEALLNSSGTEQTSSMGRENFEQVMPFDELSPSPTNCRCPVSGIFARIIIPFFMLHPQVGRAVARAGGGGRAQRPAAYQSWGVRAAKKAAPAAAAAARPYAPTCHPPHKICG